MIENFMTRRSDTLFRLAFAFLTLATFLILSSSANAQRQRPRQAPQSQEKKTIVVLEVSPDTQGAIGSQQEWMKKLQAAGADRVTSGLGGPSEASIDEKENASSITIRVKGYVSKGKLVLPGGRFSIRDTAKIKSLIAGFRKDGAEVTLSEKKAFGLTAKQLVWLHNQLTVPVEIETKGQKVGNVITTLIKTIKTNSGVAFKFDRLAGDVMDGDSTISEELKGLSTGTVLAAILRPHGLVMEPIHIKANEIALHFKDSQASKEHWPIGWPLGRPPVVVEPKMFETMPINIRNAPLDKVMEIVQKKAGVPFLYDENSMAREGIELKNFKATLSEKKIALAIVCGRLLKQTKPRMFYEFRMDEAGKGFLWITVR